MADPKYVNLPGIAVDQPDVYETEALPEADQHIDNDLGDMSDSIETLHVSANEAYGKFKGSYIDARNVDFSDKIRRRKCQGYVVWNGDYELEVKDRENETIFQKFQRLNCEVRELLDEIEKTKEENQEAGGEDPGLSSVAMAMQTSQLQDQLSAVRLEEILGSDMIKSWEDPISKTKSKLLAHFESVKNQKVSAAEKRDDVSSGDSAMYELLMKPEQSKLEEQKRIAALDKRLETIETMMSSSSDKMSNLLMDTNSKSLVDAVDILNSKVSLLSPSHLDHVEGRLAALLQKMSSVAERKAVIEDAEKQNKISELFDLCMETEGYAEAIPSIVDRLDTLQGLHDQALQFSKTMTQLDTSQQKLELSLSSDLKMLQDVKANFEDNLGNIRSNFESFDQRLQYLQK